MTLTFVIYTLNTTQLLGYPPCINIYLCPLYLVLCQQDYFQSVFVHAVLYNKKKNESYISCEWNMCK